MNSANKISNNLPRIIFAGTPDFAVPSLRVLADTSDQIDLLAAYTQPDRPAGRGRRLRESDVKKFAVERGIAIEQPASLRKTSTQQTLRDYRPDLMIVAAYGLILPQAVLDIPRLGCINVHASLLPRWRGAAPVQRAILEGDEKTGVTLMQMNAGLDTGDMLATAETAISPDETGGELTDRLAILGAELLARSLADFLSGKLSAVPQDDEHASYAKKIKKAEAKIDWQQPAAAIARRVRAFNPWPVAESCLRGRQLRLWEASCDGETNALPGTVLPATDDQLNVATGDGILRVASLQPAGKRVMSAKDFLAAHSIDGEVLGAENEDD